MNKIIEFFGRQGLFADLSTIFVLILGIFSMFTIERKVMPNVDFEMVTVSTIFPGASAEEVERLVTNPLEQELKEVEGIKKMWSTSIESQSYITLQLDPDQTTLQEGKADIQDVVERLNDLPDDSEDPLVMAIESKLEPVIIASVSSHGNEVELRKQAKFLERELEKVPGVARVNVDGMRDFEFHVEADPEKMRSFRLTLDDLVRAIQFQNVNVPGGVIEGGRQGSRDDREIIVRTIGKLTTVEDVEETVVRANSMGRAIKVKDVAKVNSTFEKASILHRTNGAPSMNLTVVKKESADAINVVDGVKETIEELKGDLPPELTVGFVNDSSYYIRRRLSVLSGNLFIGLALVLIVLSFVMPWRVAMITAVGIPFAFFGAIYIMDEFAISFNIITMMGLIIVVGMLVDDAVVVTENVVRNMETGLKPIDAAIKGAQQIWAPVTASVLTTIMAFFPMLNMSGIFGKFVKYIPIAVILALVISLYECFFILPHHLARWAGPGVNKAKRSWLTPFREQFERLIVDNYSKFLKIILQRRYIALFAMTILVVFLGFAAGKNMSFVLFPKDGVEAFVVQAEAPIGTPIAKTLEYLRPVEEEIGRIPSSEMDDYTTVVGEHGIGVGDPRRKRGSHYAQILIFLKPELERVRTAKQILESVKENVGEVPQLKRLVITQIDPGPPVGKAVSIGIQGRFYEDILPAKDELKALIAKMDGVQELTDTHSQGNDEIQVKLLDNEAAAAGLSVTAIGRTVRAAYEGLVATTIRLLDEEIDVRVSLPLEKRVNEDSLNEIMVPNAQGQQVPLKRVAKFERTKSTSQFDHEDNRREISILGDVDTEVTSSGEVNGKIRELLPALKEKHPNVDFVFGGEDEDTQESLASLAKTGVTALLGIFMILVLTFKNIFQPLLVVITIPLGLISVLLAFALHGMPMSFLGMIGMVALGGVIVNNSIVYIDFINKAREQGMDRFESIVSAGRMRIRPIFLTTVTTVCGILPTAYGLGGLDQFVVPVAMALGWGLFFGSVLAVVILPLLVTVLDDITGLFKAKDVVQSDI